MTFENLQHAAALAFGFFVVSSPNYGQTMTIPDTDSSVVAQASSTRRAAADDHSMVFETLTVRKEGAVLFAEIAAEPARPGGHPVEGDPTDGFRPAQPRVERVRIAFVRLVCRIQLEGVHQVTRHGYGFDGHRSAPLLGHRRGVNMPDEGTG